MFSQIPPITKHCEIGALFLKGLHIFPGYKKQDKNTDLFDVPIWLNTGGITTTLTLYNDEKNALIIQIETQGENIVLVLFTATFSEGNISA